MGKVTIIILIICLLVIGAAAVAWSIKYRQPEIYETPAAENPEIVTPSQQPSFKKCSNPGEAICTQDIVKLCSPDGKEQKTVPSICSCGLDAKTLQAQGWKICN